jgi:hypothetical protein
MLGVGVFFEIFLVESENCSNNSGIVLEANTGNKIRNNIEEAMGVDKGKGGGGGGRVGEFKVSALRHIFHDIGEKLELIYEMREFGCLNLGELHLEHGEAV